MGVDEVITVDDDVMNMLRDYVDKDVDVRTLPYDDLRRAAERMKDDYASGLECDYEDVITVLGEPNSGITFPQTPEQIREYFLKRMDETAERNTFLDITREDRIRARKEKYEKAGKILID